MIKWRSLFLSVFINFISRSTRFHCHHFFEKANNMSTQAPEMSRQMANAIRVLSIDAMKKPNPVIRAHRWAWRKSPKYCGVAISITTRKTELVQSRPLCAVANGHGSMLIYSLLHLDRLRFADGRDRKTSANCTGKTAGHPGIRHHTGRYIHHRPARSRDCWLRSAWPYPKNYWHKNLINRAMTSSTTSPTLFWATVV